MTGWLQRGTLGAAAVLAIGLAWLLGYVVAEALLGDGQGSVVDAYWRGRLPWIAVAETLIVVGATASAVVGAAEVMLEGGWIRRLVVLVPLGVIGLWWFLAVALSSIRAVPCDACPPRTPDPWAYAYSIPQVTLWYLILPSLIVVALALVRRQHAEPGPYISPS